jgi:hypothetical protein
VWWKNEKLFPRSRNLLEAHCSGFEKDPTPR